MWPFNRKNKVREFVANLGKDHPHTPDFAELTLSEYRLLFVCDDMMVAHHNNKLLEGHGKKVGRGFTQLPFNYQIGKHTGVGLPFMGEGLKVKGELHAVKSYQFAALDKHYGNTVRFARVPVNILVTDKDHRLMDIGNVDFLKELPEGMIRTVPELGIRHYISNPRICIIHAQMYVAVKAYWFREPDAKYLPLNPQYPKDPLVWLPKYYKYPIDRNR